MLTEAKNTVKTVMLWHIIKILNEHFLFQYALKKSCDANLNFQQQSSLQCHMIFQKSF